MRGGEYDAEWILHLELEKFVPHVQKGETPYPCTFSFLEIHLAFCHLCTLYLRNARHILTTHNLHRGSNGIEKECPELHSHIYLLSVCPNVLFLL